MEKIIVIGGGGHARVLISVLQKSRQYEVMGYCDIKNNGPLLGVEYLGDDNRIIENINMCKNLALGIGSVKVSGNRQNIAEKFLQRGFRFPYIVSPDAVINKGVNIGEGVLVCDGAVVNTGTALGDFCIINTNSSVDHDCSIKDFVHVAPGVTICGGVDIGRGSMLGAGSTLINNVRLAQNTLVTAGSVVITSFKHENIKLKGNPARSVM
ncbi:MAG: acetyltransferase [Oligoflexia bacterium]|nr:acetyltransferase [Oligoflexia bacterium]